MPSTISEPEVTDETAAGVTIVSDEEIDKDTEEAIDSLCFAVQIIEDSVMEFVEKILLDILISDPEDHTEITGQANRLFRQTESINDKAVGCFIEICRITSEIENLPEEHGALITPILVNLTYLKTERLGQPEAGLELLEKFSAETISKTYGALDIETRLQKLIDIVDSICDSVKRENVPSTCYLSKSIAN